MIGIDELQRRLAAAIRPGHAPGEAARLPIEAGGTLSAEGALDVYRAGYVARLSEALGETFEAVWWTLGDAEFLDACARYIALNPSHSTNLSDYGAGFPAFLDESEPGRELPFLRELAELEWELKELFHAAEHEHLSAEVAAELAGRPDAELRLGSACRLLRTRWAVYDLWRLRKADQTSCVRPDMDRRQRLVVYKLDGEVCVREVSEAELLVLEGLRDGSPLSAALSRAAAADPSFGADQARVLFQSITTAGLLSAGASL